MSKPAGSNACKGIRPSRLFSFDPAEPGQSMHGQRATHDEKWNGSQLADQWAINRSPENGRPIPDFREAVSLVGRQNG